MLVLRKNISTAKDAVGSMILLRRNYMTKEKDFAAGAGRKWEDI